MATANKNLSEYDEDTLPDASEMKVAIVVAEWNNEITEGLLNGAVHTLTSNGLKESNLLIKWVPGSFELPSAAQFILETKQYEAVICLGCVIQGETKHFDFVCQGVTQGIVEVSLKYNRPVIFGILTDNNKQQSIDRSGGRLGNKGDEAAVSAIKMIALQKELQEN